MGEFSHFDDQGNARMVDVSGKGDTERTAVARGSIFLSKEAMEAVLSVSPFPETSTIHC